MPELLLTLLVATSLCLLILAVVAIYTALDLRTTLRRVNAMLPVAESAIRDARRVLHRTRRIVQRSDLAARQVETIVHRACEVFGGILDRVAPLKTSVERLFFRHQNGAGPVRYKARHKHRQ